jgi:hypothetical protein
MTYTDSCLLCWEWIAVSNLGYYKYLGNKVLLALVKIPYCKILWCISNLYRVLAGTLGCPSLMQMISESSKSRRRSPYPQVIPSRPIIQPSTFEIASITASVVLNPPLIENKVCGYFLAVCQTLL